MPVCISGMHRSGTSLVARLLNLCGVYLGDEAGMIPPGPDNEQGFWEYRAFPEINEQLLAQFGGAWNYPPLEMPHAWVERPQLIPLTAQASDLIATFDEAHVWGWKDPRVSLTLPFWLKLLPSLKVVVCLRSPLAVARSLKKRETQGLLTHARDLVHYPYHLWQSYYHRLQTTCPPEQMIVTHYESYFYEPRQELLRLIQFLGLDLAQETLDEAVTSVSNRLHRQKSNVIDIATADIPLDTLETYLDLCQQAGPVYQQTASARQWQRLFPAASKQRRLALLDIRANHPTTSLEEKTSEGLHSQLYWADAETNFSEERTHRFPVNHQQRVLTGSTRLTSDIPLSQLRLDPFKQREAVTLFIVNRLNVTLRTETKQTSLFSWQEATETDRLTFVNMQPVDDYPDVFRATENNPQIIIDIARMASSTINKPSLEYLVEFQIEFVWDWRPQNGLSPIKLFDGLRQNLVDQQQEIEQKQQEIEQKQQEINQKQQEIEQDKETIRQLANLDSVKTVVLIKKVWQRIKTRLHKEARRVRGLPPLENVPPAPISAAAPTSPLTIEPGELQSPPFLTVLVLGANPDPTAVEQWVKTQTCPGLEIVSWTRQDGQLFSITRQLELGTAAGWSALGHLLETAYLCVASPDLLGQPSTYLEANLLALMTEDLALTVNIRGEIGPVQSLFKGGELPLNDNHPYFRQVVRVEYLTDDAGLDLSSYTGHSGAVGKLISHTTNKPDDPDTLFEKMTFVDLPLRYLEPYFFIKAAGDSPPSRTVHPVDTVLPVAPCTDQRPTVLVTMPFLAVGGAERAALKMMDYLCDKIRFVVVTVEAPGPHLGTSADDFRQLTPYVYTLPDYLSPSLNYSFMVHLIRRFEPATLYIANGSNWVYDTLSQIKSDFSDLRIANQVYDHAVGWIMRYDSTVAHRIDAHIGVSDKICQAYAAHGAAKESIYLINHGVDTDECDPARYDESQRIDLKKQFGLPLDRRIITFLARLHPQKRPMDFIELARQCEIDDSLHFLMVGDGPLGEQIEQEISRIGISNLIRHSYYQPGRDIYAISDVMLLPSEYEGLPLVVLESQSMGTAMVATDVGNIGEVLATTKGGQVTSQIGNVTALKQTMYAVLNNPPDGQAIRQATIEHYAVKKIAKQYYEALLDTPYA